MLRFFWIKCVFNYLQFKLNPKLTLRLKHTESVSPTTHLQFLKVKASARINFGVNLWRKTLFDSSPARKSNSFFKVSTILRNGAIVIGCPIVLVNMDPMTARIHFDLKLGYELFLEIF